MLSNIKSLILEKKEFQEAASIPYNDANNNVENLIVFHEDVIDKKFFNDKDNNWVGQKGKSQILRALKEFGEKFKVETLYDDKEKIIGPDTPAGCINKKTVNIDNLRKLCIPCHLEDSSKYVIVAKNTNKLLGMDNTLLKYYLAHEYGHSLTLDKMFKFPEALKMINFVYAIYGTFCNRGGSIGQYLRAYHEIPWEYEANHAVIKNPSEDFYKAVIGRSPAEFRGWEKTVYPRVAKYKFSKKSVNLFYKYAKKNTFTNVTDLANDLRISIEESKKFYTHVLGNQSTKIIEYLNKIDVYKYADMIVEKGICFYENNFLAYKDYEYYSESIKSTISTIVAKIIAFFRKIISMIENNRGWAAYTSFVEKWLIGKKPLLLIGVPIPLHPKTYPSGRFSTYGESAMKEWEDSLCYLTELGDDRMLNNIKSLILEKKEFQEAASILMEDATNNVEDLIVLNEDSEFKNKEEEDKEKKDKKKEDSENKPKTESTFYEKDEVMEEDSSDDEEIIDESPYDENDDMELDDDSSEDENEIDMGDTDDSSEDDFDSDNDDTIEDPNLLGSGDNGNDIDDIMHIEIDLSTNTVSDVLPRSPKDASSVVNDDTMSIGVDDSPVEPESDDSSSDSSSEFDDIDLDEEPSEEETDTDEKDDVEESFELEDDLDDFFSEAIDIGGSDDSSDNNTPPDEKAAEDNTVTSAVKDKVNEANNSSDNNSNDDITFDEEPGDDSSNDNFDIDYGDSDPNAGTEDTSSGGDEDVKSMVIKKLSNITKALEDAKNSVLSHVK